MLLQASVICSFLIAEEDSDIRWRRKWQPTPVFLPAESLRQRSLVGYSPWGHKESDMTERLTLTNKSMFISINLS